MEHLWVGDVIRIGQHSYKVDVLSACKDGVVLHATNLESGAGLLSECFRLAMETALEDESQSAGDEREPDEREPDEVGGFPVSYAERERERQAEARLRSGIVQEPML